MKKLHVYSDGLDWIIGYSPSDAKRAVKWQRHCDFGDLVRVPDDEVIAIPANKKGELVDYNSNYTRRYAVKKTAAQWAAEKGRGHLCGLDY